MKNFKNLLTIVLTLCTLTLATALYAVPAGPEGYPLDATQPDGTPIDIRVYGDEFWSYVATPEGYTVVQDTVTKIWHYAQLSSDSLSVVPSKLVVGVDSPAVLGKFVMPSESVVKDIRQKRFDELNGAGVATVEREIIQRKINNGLPAQEANTLIQKYNTTYPNETQMKPVSTFKKTTLLNNGSITAPNEAPPPLFTSDTVMGVVLLAKFKGEGEPVISRAEIDSLFNQPNYANGEDGRCSLRDYYYDQSFGKCTFTNLISPYYELPNTKEYYLGIANGNAIFVRDLLALVEADPTFDISAATDQGDRKIALSMLYTGRRPNGWATPLWPHASWGGIANKTLHGRKLWGYQMSDITSAPTIGVAAHELGHLVFSFVDYYDYGRVDNYRSQGIGAHCLMASGGLNNAFQTPSPINAYLKKSIGWITEQPLQAGKLNLAPNAATTYIYKKPGTPTEYYLFEGRCKNNGNRYHDYCDHEGLVIWHVDETKSGTEEQQRTATQHYELSLVQADGYYHLETSWGVSLNTDFYDGELNRDRFSFLTEPSSTWWDGSDANLTIANISKPASSITADVYLFSAVQDPKFTPDGASFADTIEVQIISETEGAQIYYTTNGTDPILNGAPSPAASLYTKSLILEDPTGVLVKAVAFKDGMAPSKISSSYFANAVIDILSPTKDEYITNITPHFITKANMNVVFWLEDENGNESDKINQENVRDLNGITPTQCIAGTEYTVLAISPTFPSISVDGKAMRMRIAIANTNDLTRASKSEFFNWGETQPLTIDTTHLVLNVGDKHTLTTKVNVFNPALIPTTPIVYKSKNTTIADVDSVTGIVTANLPGSTEILINKNAGLGKYEIEYFAADTVTVTVLVVSKEVFTQNILADSVATTLDSVVYVPASSPTGLDLSFTCADTTIADVDSVTGLVTPKKIGKTTIRVAQAGTANFLSTFVDVNLYVYEKYLGLNVPPEEEFTSEGVLVRWNVDAGVQCDIYRAESENGPFVKFKERNTTGSFLDIETIPGKTYFYKVLLTPPTQY